MFNEFYEEKFGETVADVRRYNDETILLCGAGNRRNRQSGTRFREKILISHYGAKDLKNGTLSWTFESEDHSIAASGKIKVAEVKRGSVTEIGCIEFDLPDGDRAHAAVLKCIYTDESTSKENFWKFWVFPKTDHSVSAGIRCENSLSADTVKFMADGGAVLLTGGFPGESMPEHFRPHTSGRSIGHSGAVPHEHPLWDRFPQDGFADWQFFPMMTGSNSLITGPDMPEYHPILELIPSFKLIKRKSLLSEFRVGKGRLMVCGFNLDPSDPAANWMKQIILEYLAGRIYAEAPEWVPEKLLLNLASKPATAALLGKKIDAGGRPIDD